jgi:hypothetical protein
MKNPRESGYKFPGATMGVSKENRFMNNAPNNMPNDYISFYKKEFIEKTYTKDATAQPMKYATRMYSLIELLITYTV